MKSQLKRGYIVPAALISASAIFLAMAPIQSQVVTQPTPEVQTPAATVTQEVRGDELASRAFCEWGFSKNMCYGELVEGEWYRVVCEEERCWTLVGRDAYLKVPVRLNPEACCNDETTCDETRELQGTLVSWITFHIRQNEPCPMRGWWSGKWLLYTDDSNLPIAEGEWQGTMGVGTHRPAGCLETPEGHCNIECEKCYVAEYYPYSRPGTWYLHVEGCLVGKVLWGHYEDSVIHATMQGFYRASGYAEELIPPTERVWGFCGTADGVVEKPCY